MQLAAALDDALRLHREGRLHDASIRYAFRFTRRVTLVTTLNLSRITRGSKLKVSCKGGKRKGCPFKSKTVKIKKGKAKLSKIFKRKHRRAKLRKGAKITVSLTKKGVRCPNFYLLSSIFYLRTTMLP